MLVILKQILIVAAVLAALPLVIRLLIKVRLVPLLIYAILTQTALTGWAQLHPILSTGIFVVLALLTILSWIMPLIRSISENRAAERMVVDTFYAARAMGFSDDQYTVSVQDGVPMIHCK